MYTPEEEKYDYFTVVASRFIVDGERSKGVGIDIDTGDVVEFRVTESAAKFFDEKLRIADSEEKPLLLQIADWQESQRRGSTVLL